MKLHGWPMLAGPGYRVTTGEVAARSLSFRQDQRYGNPTPPLTSAGGIPSGGRQGSTMPCSRDTSLASGSCSKFLRKSGGRKTESLSVQISPADSWPCKDCDILTEGGAKSTGNVGGLMFFLYPSS